ncbi:hypothetical protein SAMN02745213_00333 [Succinivibrio dextrinosolvens DSM 3072]|uniref:Nucleotidyltransferase n=1 Tax=Succinivibrio dextrinosolvens DSM 3072 TaxID=1123324 RepID=A0A1T4UZM2_9GAMM|nr:nucleotidyltransferase domain-containing protein [Succinivibrio dextrinosolvens]SKA58068.1 hypothetical protein SAMN02745213_00333 [Succinivibrio dextrinosolvens DSM 3072]
MENSKSSFEEIQCHLVEIERKHDVRILFAIESGSRAWGFASPDSDYDVRFIYVKQPEAYFNLGKAEDTLEYYPTAEMDMVGWDLGKYLKLIYKSNSVAFEWANSPIVYRNTDEWEQIAGHIKVYFNPKASIYHYYGEGAHIFKANESNSTISYKSYLYILRVILAAKFIKGHGKVPPMTFSDLVEDNLPSELKSTVKEILEIKSRIKEKDEEKRYADLDSFIREELPGLKVYAESLKQDSPKDITPLNRLFYSTVIA